MTNKPTLQDALDHGARLLQAGDSAAATQLAEALVGQFPDRAVVRLFAADAAAQREDLPAAMANLDAVPDSATEYPRALLRKAQLLFADGQRTAALQTAGQAAGLIGDDGGLMRALAGVLRDCLEPVAAHDWLVRASQIAPHDPNILYDLAMLGYHLNRPDEAAARLTRLLEQVPYHPAGLHLRSALRTQTEARNHVDDLRRRLADGPDHPRLVAAANYALAKELEDLGRFDESVAALDVGARAYRSTLRYDAATELAAHQGIRSTFTAEAFDALAKGDTAERPVFVVGMPRTGTTLVERILGAHSQLVSIGEFTEFPRLYGNRLREQVAAHDAAPSAAALQIDFAELGRAYVGAARELAGDATGFVDKLPYNFLYCGYILAALPGARIIHLTRAPLDTCYAVYKTLFFGAYSFSYDLDELADYYISYHRLMAHWHAVVPGRILDVSYEALVREPEPEVRKISDWCGLPWEPAMLDFHRQETPSMTASAMQVRQPVHTASIESWRRAEARFGPLKARLEAAGIL